MLSSVGQVVPERSVGFPLTGLQWYHIAIGTDMNRNVRIYLNGRMVYGWKATPESWEGLQSVLSPFFVISSY